MTFNRKIITILFLFLFLSISPGESKTYRIGTFKIPLWVKSNNSGAFVELFKEAAKRAGVEYKIEIYPTKRTFKYFQNNIIDGFFPAMDKSAGKAAKSSPIFVKKCILFLRKGSEPVDKLDLLKGKKIGLTLGYTYDKKITENFDIDYAISDIVNMKKLSRGRTYACIVEEKSGIAALKESGMTNIIYNVEKPLFKKNVFFAFQSNKEGKKLSKRFSQALFEMKKDGSFDRIMNGQTN